MPNNIISPMVRDGGNHSIGKPSRPNVGSTLAENQLDLIYRDPNNLNGYVKWEFSDILGEPSVPRSVDM